MVRAGKHHLSELDSTDVELLRLCQTTEILQHPYKTDQNY